jgi:7-dehydrocholesterol reductase
MWGRTSSPNIWSQGTMWTLFFTAPLFTSLALITMQKYDGSILALYKNVGLEDFTIDIGDLWTVSQIAGIWLLLQYVLALLPDVLHHLPIPYRGGVQYGNATPAGHTLPYRINGLQAFIITHLLFACSVWYGWIRPAYIVDKGLEAFYVANIFGYALTFLVYIKAHVFSSHPKDNKYSGSRLYDLIMGVELNPRLFGIDFKLFFNGRPGIVLWSILNLCFAFKQYELFGAVSGSMKLLIVLQGLYILDFFWNEAWYLKTLDIALDHFGFYLAWGDCVWLPFMYTLQGRYLAYHFTLLSPVVITMMTCMGCIGYFLFRWANHQKDAFRLYLSQNPCLEGYPVSKHIYVFPTFETFSLPTKALRCSYFTVDGKRHTSYLLLSGFWGLARHLNYVGDVILSSMWNLCCGWTHGLPHFYTVYIILLLLTRTYRDENKCQGKYGKGWTRYCKHVPYRFIPYVY